MKYPRELIKEIIAKIDLVEYIKQYVELKQRGKDYFGICPFHEDSDPSFSVSPEKNIWYCFGCGTGNTIIDFVMKYHKVKFPKAVEMLLDYLKLDVNNIKEEANIISFLKQFTYKKDLTQVEHEILPLDIMSKYIKKPIKEWLDEGIKQEVMNKYQVRYDKNANRVVFPIYDRYGNIINIKGRTLYSNYKDLGIPKYIYYYPLGCNDFLYGLPFKYDKIKELLTGDSKTVIANFNTDKGFQVVKAIADSYFQNIAPKYDEINLKNTALQRTYMKAILELSPKSARIFPDANSTLRVTYGKIKGYKPSDAVYYEPFTTLDGVMEKYIPGDYEFDVPQKLISLYNAKDYGDYGVNGKMPVCFIATNHTTGGNSGSPALDKNGNLIGLNFDRVWEGTMSDIYYSPDICRNIMVDIRYILFIIDKYADAKNIINELNIKYPRSKKSK